MTRFREAKALSQNEYYRCPLPHVHPRHKQAFFKSFDSHFSIFRNRDDHLAVLRLHEEIAWQIRHSASEKRNLTEDDLQKISLKAWLEAIKRQTGQSIRTVVTK
jgi:hypothetical protein